MKNILYEGYLGPRLPKEVQLKRVQRVIREELTQAQRETLMAHYFQKQTVTQIARERGVNKSTVSRTLKRAEEKLRRFLKY
ncbi:MAG: sigma factor-like helix-turn-helix DNA-binding protein [Eubacteriales bacterium]|nr:sigma factor-like helix-turn-helix DNA-binding protein [Eubacteriales bacterium]